MKNTYKLLVVALSILPQLGYAKGKDAEVSLMGSLDQSNSKIKDDGSSSSETTKDKSLDVSGAYLFLINNQLGIGPAVSYENSISKSTDYSDHSWTCSLGVEAKVYLANIEADKLVPYGVFRVGMIDGKFNSDKTSGYDYDVGLGLSYFLNDWVALTPEINYTMTQLKTKDGDDKSFNSKTTEGTTAISIGLSTFI